MNTETSSLTDIAEKEAENSSKEKKKKKERKKKITIFIMKWEQIQ